MADEQKPDYALRLLGKLVVVEQTTPGQPEPFYHQFRTSEGAFAFLRDVAGPDAERILQEFLDARQKFSSGLSA
jgi:hypothetical protein